MITLSIIVVSLNEAEHLSKLKRAVDQLLHDSQLTVETILVDGGSQDGSADLARNLRFSKVLECPEANIPVCRNQGIQASSGQWLAFLDGDCEPASDWLIRAAPYLEQPSPVLIGWPVQYPMPGTWVQRYWFVHWSHKRRPGNIGAFRMITTRNMLLSRSIADQVKGFDEKLTTGEDTDFVLRVTQAGFRVVATPELQVVHHGEPATLRQFFQQQLWHANRKSYKKIAHVKALRTGGNAIFFTLLFTINLLLGICAILLMLTLGNMWFGLLSAPLILLVALPASVTAIRAKDKKAFLPLCILYAAYGMARSIDLLGFHANKISWKKLRSLTK